MRSLTAAALAAAQAAKNEQIHLLELELLGGIVRLTSAAHLVTWSGNTYAAAGGLMAFAPVVETPDGSGQRLQLVLDGVTQLAIAALLGEQYIGREGRLWRAYVDANGVFVVDPFMLFRGLMNAPWMVTENIETQSSRVETELVGPLAMFTQIRGITADKNSHQAVYPNDTFFQHIADKPHGDFGWGSLTTLNPSGGGGSVYNP